MNTNALFKLNEFCAKHKIEYALTGTCALALLGIPSSLEPRDIDIIVYHPEEHRDLLKELDFLSGLPHADYQETQCYSFHVNGTKVNAILDNKKRTYKDIERETITLQLSDSTTAKIHAISVHTMHYAWTAKKKLNREKDLRYILDVINLLTLPE